MAVDPVERGPTDFSPYFTRHWYQRRYTGGGYDRSLLEDPVWRSDATREWQPDHPETAPDWPYWRVVANGWATIREADELTLEEIADAGEAMDVAADATTHQQLHMIPKPRPKDPGHG